MVKCWTRQKKNGGTYTNCVGGEETKLKLPKKKGRRTNAMLELNRNYTKETSQEVDSIPHWFIPYTKLTTTDTEELPSWLLPEDLPIVNDETAQVLEEEEEVWKSTYENEDGEEFPVIIKRFKGSAGIGKDWFIDEIGGDVYDVNPTKDPDYSVIGNVGSDGEFEEYGDTEDEEDDTEDEEDDTEDASKDFDTLSKEERNLLDPAELFGQLPVELRVNILTSGTKVGSPRTMLIDGGFENKNRENGGFIKVYSPLQNLGQEIEWKWLITLNKKRVKLQWRWTYQTEETKKEYRKYYMPEIWGETAPWGNTNPRYNYYPEDQTITVPYSALKIQKDQEGVLFLVNDFNKYVDKGRLMGISGDNFSTEFKTGKGRISRDKYL